jgi:hypothetical protein
MTENTEDIFKSMNATRVLIAVLNQIGSIEILTEDFLKINSEDRQLSVTYNDETLSFKFEIEEPGQQSDYELVND